MTPILPQILDHLGFTGVVHATLDDGRFPVGNTSRQRWEGIDGTTVEALLRVPIDASRAEGFLRLPHALSGVADMDNQPTVIFAHWPGNTSPWYEDIHRARRYTTVLGSFRTLPDYFERTGTSGHQTAPKADEYRSPYLKQAVAAGQPDPISRWVRYYRAASRSRGGGDARHPGHVGRRQACGLRRQPLGRHRWLVGDACRRCSLDERLTDVGKTAAADFARAIGAQPRIDCRERGHRRGRGAVGPVVPVPERHGGRSLHPDTRSGIQGTRRSPGRPHGGQSAGLFPPRVRGRVRTGPPARDGRRRSTCR